MLHACACGDHSTMSFLRSDANDQHLFMHALMRALAAIGFFTLLGTALGALWGWIDGEFFEHVAQGIMIGAGFGGIAGVIASLMGVPNRDSSADV